MQPEAGADARGGTLDKRISLGLYVLAAVIILMYHEKLLAMLRHLEPGTGTLVILFLTAVAISLVPVIPFGVVAGIIGAAYGFWIGGWINVAASTLGAAFMFLAVRCRMSKQGRQAMERIHLLRSFNQLMEHNAFAAVLIGRMIPIIPAVAINAYAAMLAIPLRTFMVATVLGKLPVMFLFAYVGEQLLQDWTRIPVVLLLYAVYVAGIYGIHRVVERSRTRRSRT
ncbi:MAG: VTT domain-containing protein [Paenibacillus sp.]